jgi:transcriptional regulator with XRE-family HTH domain
MANMKASEFMKRFTPAERAKIDRESRELIAQARALAELRKARELTQVDLAKRLGVDQAAVSQLESRADVLVSTLKGYVRGLGGDLSIVAKFPDAPSVELTCFADIDPLPQGTRQPRARATKRKASATTPRKAAKR